MENDTCRAISNQNIPLGILYIIHGLFYLPFYIPCFIAISTNPLIKISCYQIMTSMGVLDLVAITYSSLICGYWSITGFSFCNNPSFMKAWGALASGIWYTYCANCVTLALNRMLESNMGTSSAEKWFSNRKTIYWILACFSYGAASFAIFMSPLTTLMYNSKVGVLVFDPHSENKAGIAIGSFNNITTITLLTIFYIIIAKRTKEIVGIIDTGQATEEELSALKTKRMITTQCWCICIAVGLSCCSYTITPMVTVEIKAFQLATIFWQMTQGINGIIYLTLNKTIRQRVKEILKISAAVTPTVAPSNTPNVQYHHGNDVIVQDY